MFEKEAEETVKRCVCGDCNKCQSHGYIGCDTYRYSRDSYLRGAEFSYNKANEWHYVKDDLPKDNEYVLIYTDLNNCYVAKKVENHFMSKGWGFIPMSTVIAWKEIILPELKEVEDGN